MNAPTPPNLLYRFRSIEALLDKYHELENQTIYFASPEELNDPMEGFQDIVWKGDKIVWGQFFRHYFGNLLVFLSQHRGAADSVELGGGNFSIQVGWEVQRIPDVQWSLDDIWDMFVKVPNMQDLIEVLPTTNYRITSIELQFYLEIITLAVFTHNPEFWLGSEAISKHDEQVTGLSHGLQELLGLLIDALTSPEDTETEEKTKIARLQIQTLRAIQRFRNQASEATFASIGHLFLDFPNQYVSQADRLLWSNWYTACFMENYHSSPAWGHYGDGHKGACLIFDSGKAGVPIALKLHHMTDRLYGTIQTFYKVSYENQLVEVDFFRYIGRLRRDELKRQWYTDKDGNESERGRHFQSDSEAFQWIDQHQNLFYRIATRKTEHWRHEQEYRLIIEDTKVCTIFR